ncbi:MAG TPA: hypothetical protein VMU51_11215 [Mycobacteriales bacterium]|nr:hypothetical protein [Mycobacteriales bacterium]
MGKLTLTAAASTLALSPLTLAMPATASSQSHPSSVTPLHANCGTAGPNLDGHRVNDAAFTGAARQRTGSSIDCGAPGSLQPTDDAIYFCWTFGNDGFSWSYVQNIRTGVRGWTRDNLLRENGARLAAHCF